MFMSIEEVTKHIIDYYSNPDNKFGHYLGGCIYGKYTDESNETLERTCAIGCCLSDEDRKVVSTSDNDPGDFYGLCDSYPDIVRETFYACIDRNVLYRLQLAHDRLHKLFTQKQLDSKDPEIRQKIVDVLSYGLYVAAGL